MHLFAYIDLSIGIMITLAAAASGVLATVFARNTFSKMKLVFVRKEINKKDF